MRGGHPGLPLADGPMGEGDAELALGQAMEGFAPPLPVLVAFSGGADSTALLLQCVRRWPGQVLALHVHHGLQVAADGFEAQCKAVCVSLGVPLAVERVQARGEPGDSPEDAARRARYAALDRWLAGPEGSRIASVALAHHADDQVETMLLALSRGTGVAGLAAMPARWTRGGRPWFRPFLDVPARTLRAWLSQQGHTWAEDPSNTDTRYVRNRIRARLLPELEAAFPSFRSTFARTARHAADASLLLNDIAQDDLVRVGAPPLLAALQSLSSARQANVLRFWLRSVHGTTPSAAQLAQLQQQIAACTTRGHRIHLKAGRGFVVRVGVYLDWTAPAKPSPEPMEGDPLSP